MKKNRPPQDDPFQNIREWQDHRYDPGYFTGGRIDPLLKAGRPNRYGWVLLVIGLGGLIVVFSTPRGDTAWWQYLGAAAVLLLYSAAGFKLMRRRGRR